MMSASAPAVLSVAIVEDREDIRQGLAYLIGNTEGFRCNQVCSCMEDALSQIPKDPPQVALIDIGLPGMSGIEGISVLHRMFPAMALLVLTVYEDDERIFSALSAGATGYLLKRTAPARLLECLHEAASGGSPMSPEVARRVVSLFRRFAPADPDSQGLTRQEINLLKLLAEGHQYKTAAIELGLSIHTVSFHVRNIYGKLHAHSKSEAVAKAIRDGLV